MLVELNVMWKFPYFLLQIQSHLVSLRVCVCVWEHTLDLFVIRWIHIITFSLRISIETKGELLAQKDGFMMHIKRNVSLIKRIMSVFQLRWTFCLVNKTDCINPEPLWRNGFDSSGTTLRFFVALLYKLDFTGTILEESPGVAETCLCHFAAFNQNFLLLLIHTC